MKALCTVAPFAALTLCAAPAAAGTIEVSNGVATYFGKVVAATDTAFRLDASGLAVVSGSGMRANGQIMPLEPSYTVTCAGGGSPCDGSTPIMVRIASSESPSSSVYLSRLHFELGTATCNQTGSSQNDASYVSFSFTCGPDGNFSFLVGMDLTVNAAAPSGNEAAHYTITVGN